jgi:hypothetical protein
MDCSSIALYSDLLPEPVDWPIPRDVDSIDAKGIAEFYSIMVDTVVLTDVSTRRHVEIVEVTEVGDDDDPVSTTYFLNGLVAGRMYCVSGSVAPLRDISEERRAAFVAAAGPGRHVQVLCVSFTWLPCELSFDRAYSYCLLTFVGIVSKTNLGVSDASVVGAGASGEPECTWPCCCVFLHGYHAKLC